ncbi:hypothetical protein [Fimbriiglobus ruber]|uniref:hypothetical protein n=1 Tax=Fimbriiglobus ruber TaxID=1908690 RepID=UPI000B4BA26C|nr:hypothetical protein [Fimbriiglobus ruber]
MDPKELLKLLDLDGRPPDPPGTSPIGPSAPDETRVSVGASPTALEVDAWGLRRGRDLVAASDRVRVAGADAFAAADYFTAAFDPDPRPTASCADPRRHQFLTRLLDTPEYHALHATTRLDDTAAAIAAAHFAEQFAQLRKEEETERDPTAPADHPGGAGGRLDREMATLRAVGRAVTAADKEVAELHDTAAALGLGPGRRAATTRGRWRPRSSGSAATPPCGGSATWPAGSGGSPSRSSGRRPSTGWTTWSGSRRAATSADSCPPNWPGWSSPSSNSTPSAGSSRNKPCVAV